jgi:hypothetical protein
MDALVSAQALALFSQSVAGGTGATASERRAQAAARNTRTYRGLNQCRQPSLATLAGVTSLAAGISTSLLRKPGLHPPQPGFLYGRVASMSEHEKFQINYGWTSKREMVICARGYDCRHQRGSRNGDLLALGRRYYWTKTFAWGPVKTPGVGKLKAGVDCS